MSSRSRRVSAALLAAVALSVPAAASAQDSTIPDDGAGVSATPPVPLDGDGAGDGPATTRPETTAGSELPNTGSDPRLLLMTGLALSLLGLGLRMRTVDADLY
ncbi:MAG: LPXTG cell wall anchor domain-containing protein [Solirubrobacteraceae bacterium]|nr:LPXTG cell wall anchor domain-containing protein [Solirubrobacteraceae bacterium]